MIIEQVAGDMTNQGEQEIKKCRTLASKAIASADNIEVAYKIKLCKMSTDGEDLQDRINGYVGAT